uniref:Uncharacterized protein n=1 Tax=Chenopodium quinoa TaxID=63459 RepID=A0A803KVP7_CHEQI
MATDANSVLYLHPNDGSYSISVDKLTGASDYRSWRRSMEIALTSKKKIGFVLGTVIRSTYAADAVKADQWDTCNSMLENRFSMANGSRKYKLNKDLYQLKQNSNTINENYTTMSSLWEELDSMSALPVISEISAKSLISKAESDISAMYGRQFPAKPTLICSHCGGKGHTQNKCWYIYGFPKKQDKPRLNPVNTAQFPVIEGSNITLTSQQFEQLLKHMPTSSATKGSETDEEIENSFSGMVSCNHAESVLNGWIIDSGASDHMTYDLSKFTDPKIVVVVPKITLPTGDSASISHTGNVSLCNSLNLHNVLCVPKFRYNLLSVPKLTKDSQCEVNFYGTHCVIRDVVSKKIRGIGKAKNGMYYLVNEPLGADLMSQAQNTHNYLAAQSDTGSVPFAVWHHRLGHASVKKLQYIPCVKKTIKENSQICVTCPMAKFTKLPYQLSESHAAEPFELIHMDIWGPYKVCTREKYRQSKFDYSLFIKENNSSTTAILVYVDDLLITGNDKEEIQVLKSLLSSHFHMKDLGKLRYFLGLEVDHSDKGIFISQRKYTVDLLKDQGMLQVKALKLPMDTHLKLSADKGTPLPNLVVYQHLLGKLIYLTVTRPDIAFTVQILSQFMHSPTATHLQAAKRLLRYLAGTVNQGILLASSSAAKLLHCVCAVIVL